jgi:hypothetical protein
LEHSPDRAAKLQTLVLAYMHHLPAKNSFFAAIGSQNLTVEVEVGK